MSSTAKRNKKGDALSQDLLPICFRTWLGPYNELLTLDVGVSMRVIETNHHHVGGLGCRQRRIGPDQLPLVPAVTLFGRLGRLVVAEPVHVQADLALLEIEAADLVVDGLATPRCRLNQVPGVTMLVGTEYLNQHFTGSPRRNRVPLDLQIAVAILAARLDRSRGAGVVVARTDLQVGAHAPDESVVVRLSQHGDDDLVVSRIADAVGHLTNECVTPRHQVTDDRETLRRKNVIGRRPIPDVLVVAVTTRRMSLESSRDRLDQPLRTARDVDRQAVRSIHRRDGHPDGVSRQEIAPVVHPGLHVLKAESLEVAGNVVTSSDLDIVADHVPFHQIVISSPHVSVEGNVLALLGFVRTGRHVDGHRRNVNVGFDTENGQTDFAGRASSVGHLDHGDLLTQEVDLVEIGGLESHQLTIHPDLEFEGRLPAVDLGDQTGALAHLDRLGDGDEVDPHQRFFLRQVPVDDGVVLDHGSLGVGHLEDDLVVTLLIDVDRSVVVLIEGHAIDQNLVAVGRHSTTSDPQDRSLERHDTGEISRVESRLEREIGRRRQSRHRHASRPDRIRLGIPDLESDLVVTNFGEAQNLDRIVAQELPILVQLVAVHTATAGDHGNGRGSEGHVVLVVGDAEVQFHGSGLLLRLIGPGDLLARTGRDEEKGQEGKQAESDKVLLHGYHPQVLPTTTAKRTPKVVFRFSL